MAAITTFSNFSQLIDFKNFSRFVSAWASQVTQLFNGNIQFVSNIRASGVLTVSFTTPAAIVEVPHTLGTVPSGFLLIKLTGTNATILSVDSGTSAWTSGSIYLSASAACEASIYVI